MLRCSPRRPATANSFRQPGRLWRGSPSTAHRPRARVTPARAGTVARAVVADGEFAVPNPASCQARSATQQARSARPAGKSCPGNVVPSLTKGGKLLRRVGEDGAPSRRRRSRTRSCRSCLGGQRGLYLVAAALDVAAGPVPDGQRFATTGSAPLAGGVEGAGGPARSGAADHRVSSGQA